MKLDVDNLLDEITTSASERYASSLRIETRAAIPDAGEIPLEGARWLRFDDVTCVFADMLRSTSLSVRKTPQAVAQVYELFTGNAVRLLNAFGVDYVDVRGDGAFGLFSGSSGVFKAFAAAVTIKTFIAERARPIARQGLPDFTLGSHIGIQAGRLLAKKIGLRGEMQNEVWAGRPVNVAAKLASIGQSDELVISPDVYNKLNSPYVRQSCGCTWNQGRRHTGKRTSLWEERAVPVEVCGFDTAFVLKSNWCPEHGRQYCQEILKL